ncbi:hypothetical protein GN156_08410 [bacterium LRH843]|nr:hypothetical protein [bacterium LRH843]
MKKGTVFLLIAAAILVLAGFVIPVTVGPGEDTRVIIDHTKKVYSAPSCFDQAGLTNNLEETTLGHAKELAYVSESACTDAELTSEKQPFLVAIFK